MFMWGVSLTHPEFWGVSFTHPMLLHFYVGSFSYTSRAGFIFVWGVSLTHPVLASFLSGEFLLHIPCWLHLIFFLSRASILCGEFLLHIPCWLHSYLGSFSYTARVFFVFFLNLLFREFLLHIPCWLHVYARSFSYTSRVLGSFFYASNSGFTFIWGVSLTHPVLVSFLCDEFLLHIPFWLLFIWDVSLTRPMLFSSFFCCFLFVCLLLLLLLLLLLFYKSREFLLHTPCWLELYLGSFTYTPSARLIFSVGSFSYTALAGFIFYFIWDFIFYFICGEFLLHIPCWLYYLGVHFYVGSFSYTSRAGFMFMWGVSLTHPEFWGVSFTHPMLVSLLRGEFLLHIPCWFHFYVGSFSYTSRACFFFIWGVSLTHPNLLYISFLSGVLLQIPWWLYSFLGEFLLHIPFWLYFLFGEFLLHVPCFFSFFFLFLFYLGSFSYTSHAGLNCIWGVLLPHPVLASFFCGEFLLHMPCWLFLFFYLGLHFYVGSFSYTSLASFSFIWGVSLTQPVLDYLFFFGNLLRVSLTHPVLASCLCGEFLLHIPRSGEFLLRIRCWFHFYVGSFSYTSRAGFILCREFLLHIPCWFHFYVWSFSYRSRAGFMFIWGVSLTHPKFWGVSFTHPVLVSLLCGEFLLHIPCWFHFYVESFSYTFRPCFLFI